MRNIFWSMTLVIACLLGAFTAQAQNRATANNAKMTNWIWLST